MIPLSERAAFTGREHLPWWLPGPTKHHGRAASTTESLEAGVGKPGVRGRARPAPGDGGWPAVLGLRVHLSSLGLRLHVASVCLCPSFPLPIRTPVLLDYRTGPTPG